MSQKQGDDPEYGMLSVDLQNAFYHVSRNAYLLGLLAHFLILLAWVSYCNVGEALYFWAAETFLQFATRVQLGDPCGPLIFPIVLHLLALKLQDHLASASENQENPCFISAGYLDDAYHVLMKMALDFLRYKLMSANGFHLNCPKCYVW